MKQYNDAVVDFSKAITFDPKLAAAYSMRGDIYLGRRDYDHAIADYSAAIPLNSRRCRISIMTAATPIWRAGLRPRHRRLRPDNQAQSQIHGRILQPRQRLFAKTELRPRDRRLLSGDQAHPEYTAAYVSRGNAYFGKRDYDRAVTDFSQAMKLNPKYTFAYSVGKSTATRSDYDRAIVDYDQAIKLNPKYTAAYFSRGNVYFNKGTTTARLPTTARRSNSIPNPRAPTTTADWPTPKRNNTTTPSPTSTRRSRSIQNSSAHAITAAKRMKKRTITSARRSIMTRLRALSPRVPAPGAPSAGPAPSPGKQSKRSRIAMSRCV